jgi:hypothetical protein
MAGAAATIEHARILDARAYPRSTRETGIHGDNGTKLAGDGRRLRLQLRR